MVLVPGVIVPRVRLEQVVTGGHLEGHAGRRPDIGRRPVSGAEKDLQAAVLPCLDVLREVMVLQKQARLSTGKILDGS